MPSRLPRSRGASFLAALLTALVPLAAWEACAPRPESSPRFRNLVVVLVDTLRSDHLPSYGYARPTAPYLTRLAEEGIQLQGYAASSWTRPSVATLLTGLSPQRHQTLGRSDLLPADAPYLPQILADRGFFTAAYMANRNVGRKWGFARGFGHFWQGTLQGKEDGSTVTDAVLDDLASMTPPFFLYVHYVDPHDPYLPEQPWGYDPASPQPHVQPRRILDGREAFDEANLGRLRDQYDGEIRDLDRHLERLLHGLGQAGLLEETLVVVTSDHGEELGEHGGLTHGRTLHEEVLRVPLLLWSPGGLSPYRSEAIFPPLDVMPTVLSALGVEIPPGVEVEGRDRWAEVTQERLSVSPPPLFFHLDLDASGALALRQGRWKLIHRHASPHTLLFDLSQDPQELDPKVGEDSTEETAELLSTLLRHHNRLSREALSRGTADTEDELRKGLAALGYLRLDTPEEELRRRVVPDRLPRELGFADPRFTRDRDLPDRTPGGGR